MFNETDAVCPPMLISPKANNALEMPPCRDIGSGWEDEAVLGVRNTGSQDLVHEGPLQKS